MTAAAAMIIAAPSESTPAPPRATWWLEHDVGGTGEDCYFRRLHVRDVEHLEEVIDRFAPYGQTTTSILQSAPVPRGASRYTQID